WDERRRGGSERRRRFRGPYSQPPPDAFPDPTVGLDRLHHQVQLAEPALPCLHQGTEALVHFNQNIGARAPTRVERAHRIFSRQRAEIVVVHDVRHCSISDKLRRNDAFSRSAEVSSLTASWSRLKAP